MPSPDTDRNLLFGVLAFQADLVDAHQFAEGCAAWAAKKGTPLADLLVEKGWLTAAERAAVDLLLQKKVQKHGDAHASLAAVAGPEVRRALDTIDDADVEQSLASLPAEAHASDLPTVDAHPVAGRYRVLRPHARGGLGEVFVALDTELNREVALKEIRAQHAQDPGSRSRFLLEAEVTGGLEHPSIVPVYGLGQYADGRPCYAMRLIRGETLKNAIRRFHDADVPGRDPGKRSLALRGLLNRFVAVCNAVAYAHSRGVIHRDIKPANVMLGKYGELLVVDWGLAKAVGRSEATASGDEPTLRPSSADNLATQMGAAIGTPAFMAPEQALGRLDLLGPPSDIYSLGATLYDLLTGRAPFEGSDKGEVLQQVTRGAWRPPLQVKRGTPPALNAVCSTAMSLKQEDRYATALDLAADLEHWLADEPVAAYQEPLVARLGRWGRRHKALVSGAAAALLAAVLLGGGGWVWFQQDKAAWLAEAARIEQERGLQVSAELARVATLRDQAREAPPERQRSLLAEALAAAERADGLLAQGGADDEVRQRVRALLTELREGERDRRMLARLEEVRLAGTAVRDGRFYEPARDAEYAGAFRDYGIDLSRLGDAEAAAQLRARPIGMELAAALDDWATVTPQTGERARLRALAQAADPDEGRNRLRQALAKGDLQAVKELAVSDRRVPLAAPTAVLLARALMQQKAFREAEAVLRQALQRYPSDFWLYHGLGWLFYHQERPQWDEAVRFWTAAVAVRGQSPGAHNNLGLALAGQGRLAEAVAAYRRALALKPDYPEAHNHLGIALAGQEKLAEALAAYQRAIALRPDYPEPHHNLGLALAGQGRLAEAVAAYQRAIALRPDYLGAHYNLGLALAKQNKPAEAVAAYRRALALKPDYPETHVHLGNALAGQGQWAEATAAFQRAIALKPDYFEAHVHLGNALAGQGQLAEATAAYQKAIALKPDLAGTHYNLGNALAGQGRRDEAVAAYRRAVALKPDYPEAHNNLGLVLAGQGQLAEAIAAYQRAIALKPDSAMAHCNLGHALRRAGHLAPALAALRRGHELGSRTPRWPYPSAHWVQEAERLLALDAKLPDVLRGPVQPADNQERVGFARLCQQPFKGLYATSARFWQAAFAADPQLAEDMEAGHRYNAACAAALAGCGGGEDAAKLGEEEKVRLRKQGLEWLKADLALHVKQFESGKPEDRAAAQKTLRHWQTDGDLAGVRAPAALAKLPEPERQSWETLWAEVAAVLAKTNGE
jgi:tetratricopeptide (TPR) repeat protein/tRNA A-37 threonylcarbamoyl transferase component Bud32